MIVVNYGSHRLLASHLTTPALSTGPVNLVIVDNYSTDAERTTVLGLCADRGWYAVPRERNDGFGAGVNAGVARARALGADTVVIVNPDAVVSPEVLGQLITAARQSPDTAWSPTLRRSDGRAAFAGGSLDLRRGTLSGRGLPPDLDGSRSDQLEPWLSGACLAMSLELWDRLGGFDDDYFMYWEDVDLTVRAHRLGAHLRMLEGASIIHDPGGTQGATSNRSIKSALYVRYNCRNRLVFAAKLIAPRNARSWILRSPAFAREVALRSGRRALLQHRELLVAAVTGTIEGLRYWAKHRRDERN